MRTVEQPIMHHLEGGPCFNERLIPAERVLFDFRAVKPGGLLRIDQSNASERTLVPQVFLPAGVTAVEVLYRFKPALVVQDTGKLGEPGTQAVGDAVGHPQADLRLALYAVLPPIRLLDADAEDADDGFSAHGCAEFLPVLPIGPRRREPTAGL